MEASPLQRDAVQKAVRIVALAGIILLSGFQLVSWISPISFELVQTDYLALVACALALLLDLWGVYRLAVGVLVVAGWVLVIWAVLIDGGLHSVSMVGFLPVLALTMLVGRQRRWAPWWSVASLVLLTIGIVVMQQAGLIHPVTRTSPLTTTMRLLGSIAVLGVVLWWGLSRIGVLQVQAAEARRQATIRAAAVQLQKGLIEEVVACLPGAMWVSDPELKRTTWLSPTWSSILGTTPKPGASLSEILGCEHPPEERVQICHRDGTPRWLRQHTVALDDGQVIGLVVDETAHRQREQALQQHELRAQRARHLESMGRLAGEAAHDTNNVLMIAQSMAQITADRLPHNHPVQEDLAAIDACCLETSKGMVQLMAFSQQRPQSAQRICISEVVRRAEGLLRLLLPETIKLVVDIEQERFLVVGAPGLLEQALVNLIDAASERARLIEVRVRYFEDQAVLSLSPVESGAAIGLLAPFLATCEHPTIETGEHIVRLLLEAAH